MNTGGAPQDGLTPLHAAAAKNYAEAVSFLVDAGADITASDKVREGRGERMMGARTVHVFLSGVACRLLTGGVLSRVELSKDPEH